MSNETERCGRHRSTRARQAGSGGRRWRGTRVRGIASRSLSRCCRWWSQASDGPPRARRDRARRSVGVLGPGCRRPLVPQHVAGHARAWRCHTHGEGCCRTLAQETVTREPPGATRPDSSCSSLSRRSAPLPSPSFRGPDGSCRWSANSVVFHSLVPEKQGQRPRLSRR
jgi:hypothetical protein